MNLEVMRDGPTRGGDSQGDANIRQRSSEERAMGDAESMCRIPWIKNQVYSGEDDGAGGGDTVHPPADWPGEQQCEPEIHYTAKTGNNCRNTNLIGGKANIK